MMTLDVSSLAAPVFIRSAVPLTDEELIRFSEVNKPYRFERNKYGEIVMMTPVGGIGGTNQTRVAAALTNWTDETGTGISFSPNTGFNLPDGSCLSPDAAWVSLVRWDSLTPDEQAGFPPLCPEFLIKSAREATLAAWWKPRCSFGLRTASNWRGLSIRLMPM